MKPGTTVRYTRLPFLNRTGTVVEPLPRDAAWPGYVRVQLDTAPDGSPGARLQLDLASIERIDKPGQLGLFGGAA